MIKGQKRNEVPKEDRRELTCTECKGTFDKSKFGVDGKTTAGRQKYKARCKECEKKRGPQGQRKVLLEYASSVKEKCLVCGYTRCKEVLEFHHLDPAEKDESISQMITDGWSLDELKNEISKCVVLCNRCHREYHYGIIELKI